VPEREDDVDEQTSDTVAPAGPGARRMTRPRSGRVVGGVAAGIAQHLRLDVTLVRVLVVLVTVVTSGLGVLAYVLLWVLVPSDDDPGLPPDEARAGDAAARPFGPEARGTGFWVGLAMVVAGVLWLSSFGGAWFVGGPGGRGWLLPVALIGIGLALWLSEDTPVAAPAAGGERGARTAPGSGAATATDALGSGAGTAATAADVGGGGPPAPPPGGREPPSGGHEPVRGPVASPPPRERSPLTRVTLGLTLLVVGAVWLVGRAGVVDIGPRTLLGSALLVIALGLLVGSLWGRARLLVLAGAPVALLLLAALTAPFVAPPVVWGGTVGRSVLVVDDPGRLQASYEHGAGELRLDLRDLDLDRDTRTRIWLGAGEVEVVLPASLAVEVDARATVGDITVLGVRRTGVGPSLTTGDDGEGGPTLDLEIRVGAGEIDVRRDGEGGLGGRSWWGDRTDPAATDRDVSTAPPTPSIAADRALAAIREVAR
jgi:phage shock protein PspC (stress-responsive transcriptional regulator)